MEFTVKFVWTLFECSCFGSSVGPVFIWQFEWNLRFIVLLHRSNSTGSILSFGEELFSTHLSDFLVSDHEFFLVLFISLWQELTVSVNSKVILIKNAYLLFIPPQANSHPVSLLKNILALISKGLQLVASVSPFMPNKHFEIGRIGPVPDLLLRIGNPGVEIESRTE